MEKFISDIEEYCAKRGVSPQKLLRLVINAKWSQWQDWKDGKSSPTMKVADRLRAHMAEDCDAHANAVGDTYPGIQGDSAA